MSLFKAYFSYCSYTAIVATICCCGIAACAQPRAEKKTVLPKEPDPIWVSHRIAKVPLSIRQYYKAHGLAMADSGERWNAGCVRQPGENDSQLDSVIANTVLRKYIIVYDVGGIALHTVTDSFRLSADGVIIEAPSR